LEQADEIAAQILIAEREIARQIAAGKDIREIRRCDEVVRGKSEGVSLPQLRAVEGSSKVLRGTLSLAEAV
jgi:hypothetical protein